MYTKEQINLKINGKSLFIAFEKTQEKAEKCGQCEPTPKVSPLFGL